MLKQEKAKVKRLTAITSMIVLGILAIIFAIRGFVIDLTPSTYGIIGLAIGGLLILEVGIKRITKLSRLKRLSPQQYIGLAIAILVLITGAGLLWGYEIPVISTIANGSFLTGGIWIILEAVQFG